MSDPKQGSPIQSSPTQGSPAQGDPTNSNPALPWRVDLHAHTIFSKDSLAHVQAQIDRAREIGLTRLAITEHNRLDGALRAKELAPDLVIVGEEIKTTKGEIIAWYITEMVPKGLSPQETIARLRDQGAVISIPHPLDSLRSSAMGLENVLEIIDLVDALEVLNARCVKPKDNDAALELARKYGKIMTAGSDAHIPAELGHCYMQMPPFEDSAEGLRTALAVSQPAGKVSAFWPHFASTWAKLRKRVVPVDLSIE